MKQQCKEALLEWAKESLTARELKIGVSIPFDEVEILPPLVDVNQIARAKEKYLSARYGYLDTKVQAKVIMMPVLVTFITD